MTEIPGYTFSECLHTGKSTGIYRARRNTDNQPVVIKVSSSKALSEKKAQRFRREFELSQSIDSPYVVKYLELKQDPSYGMALIMEDDKAVKLTSVIPATGFSEVEFLAIAIQLVQGLQAIHAANIVHHDLKPSNIVFQPQTRAIKIIDFNRASTLRQEKHPAVSTQVEVGTLAYLSPEQTGRINRPVDYRTDFYSLGVTFYQILCGVLPFTATDALSLIHDHLAKTPVKPHLLKSSISPLLSELILKLLAKEAENRYQSGEGLLHDLQVCQQRLQATGTIGEFELGQQDFSSKLTLSQHLYGREKEIDCLMHTFERVSQGSREVLMVAGEPGVGKSMLIQELQQPISLKKGYFLQGKFDQLNKNRAYSAISQAFDGLIKQLLTEDDVSMTQWKQRLQVALGSQAQLITQVVPMLKSLLGPQPPAQIAEPQQAKNLFNLMFLKFIQVFANATHPLVIFLDDLQWADSASLELMTYLLIQPSIRHFMWIGAYRDTEVSAYHPALHAVKALQEAQVNIQTLFLAPLNLDSLQQWLTDSLHLSLADIQLLVELIYPKTAGNPFFVKCFMQSLYGEQLLTFSPQFHWQWNLEKIRRHPATENVISFMTYQIRQLPKATQQALTIASCLGHRLALTTLQTAMAQDKGTVDELLQPALNSTILVQTDGEIQFAHDRVQEAAYDLLSEPKRAQMHLTLGKRLLACKEVSLLDIVAQYNQGRSLVTELQERLQLAWLNLTAGQQAKQATAYMTALNYLYASRDWIEAETLWQIDYPLALTLHKELAETEYLCGHFETSQALIAAMQPHLQSTLDKVELYLLLIKQKTLQGLQQEAIVLGHQALQLLGSGLPLDNPREYIQFELPMLKQRLADRPLSSLLAQPLVSEPEQQAIFKILADLMSPCYQLGSELLTVITLMTVSLSLTFGHAPESCEGYAMYGFLLCAKDQNYAEGYAFGELALQLAEKLQSSVQRCRSAVAMYGFIYAWSKPIHQLPALLASAFELGMVCGEIEYAGYCGNLRLNILLNQGVSLAGVQQEIVAMLEFAQSIKATGVIYNTTLSLQKITANLLGETQHEADFDDSAISEAEFEKRCKKGASSSPLGFYLIYKARTLYLYGQAEQALQQLELAKGKLACLQNIYITAIFNWYDSLIRLALYPTASSADQQAYLQHVTKNQQQMKTWVNSCPENFAHKYRLVEAELARLQDQHEQAEAYYDQAIEGAGQQGFIQEQALAAELAAKALLARNKRIAAQGYLNMALTGYKQWGAKRKVMQLKAQYRELLQPFAPALSQLEVDSHTTLSAHTLKSLDLASIIQASQEIFKEIELDKLLQTLIQRIVNTAGAQKGTLFFVEPDESLIVKAEYAEDGTITTLQNTPLANWSGGAQNVIQYVKCLQQLLVLDNASGHEQFKADAYIQRTQAKSILCLPILQPHRLIAILYAENNLLTHVFTAERVQTLQVLTTPMAIALENAWYVAEHKRLEEARHQEVVKRAEQAEYYRKQQEDFIDTICHELRNPLNGILGNLDVQRDAIKAIKAQPDVNAMVSLESAVQAIETCAEHQRDVINQTLELSNLEQHQVKPIIQAFSLKQALETVIKMHQTQLQQKQFTLQLPPDDYVVESDGTRFKQIVMNLLAYAIHSAPEAGAIRLSLQVVPQAGRQAQVQVQLQHAGMGFTEEEKAQFFYRFSQVSRSKHLKYNSSGLGVIISKQLAELLGGTLQLDSQKWQSTTFIVTFNWPLAVIPAITPANPESPLSVTTPSEQTEPRAIKILVVEDNIINQKVLKRHVENAGYICDVANDGVEALEKYQTFKPQLVFMDIEMPRKNGLDATRDIRTFEREQQLPTVPIYAVTGYVSEKHQADTREAGMNGFIGKPFKKEDILNAIAQALPPQAPAATRLEPAMT